MIAIKYFYRRIPIFSHIIFRNAGTVSTPTSMIEAEYASYVKNEIRLNLVTDPDFLQNKDKLGKKPKLQKAIMSYLAILNEGDTSTSPQRKYEVMKSEVFENDGRFEKKLQRAILRAEYTKKQLEDFLKIHGEKCPNITKFMKEMDSVALQINCTFCVIIDK